MYLIDVILVLYSLTFESLTIFHLQIKYEKEFQERKIWETKEKYLTYVTCLPLYECHMQYVITIMEKKIIP